MIRHEGRRRHQISPANNSLKSWRRLHEAVICAIVCGEMLLHQRHVVRGVVDEEITARPARSQNRRHAIRDYAQLERLRLCDDL